MLLFHDGHDRETIPSSGGFASNCGRTITYPDGTTDTETYSWTYDVVGF